MMKVGESLFTFLKYCRRMVEEVECTLGRHNFLDVKFFTPSMADCRQHCQDTLLCRSQRISFYPQKIPHKYTPQIYPTNIPHKYTPQLPPQILSLPALASPSPPLLPPNTRLLHYVMKTVWMILNNIRIVMMIKPWQYYNVILSRGTSNWFQKIFWPTIISARKLLFPGTTTGTQ